MSQICCEIEAMAGMGVRVLVLWGDKSAAR